MTRFARRAAASPGTIAALAIVLGLVAAAYGWTSDRGQFWYSYLVAWLFWLGVSLGSLSLLLLHNLSGGLWGIAIRPWLRGAASVLPALGLVGLPIFLQPQWVYEWADPSHVEHDPILQYKQPYLNAASFQLRAAIYFGLWIGLLAILAWQTRVGPLPETPADRRFRRFSGIGLALHGLAVTFASVDWMMSLEPHWFSMIYGVIWFATQGVTALALAIALASLPPRREPILAAAGAKPFHDLGKLLLGLVMFWTYVQFSQFFIIWNGNLPEEVVWYIRRLNGGWQWGALALVVLRFALPFALLLSRELKRDPRRLGPVALLVFAMHWVELVWMVEPAVHRGAVRYVPWLDAALTVALGGAWWLLASLFASRIEPPALRHRAKEAGHG